jgi:3-phosphoshikimate 1-carboxyvinyltransferase
MTPKPESIARWTDAYFNRSRRVVESFGDHRIAMAFAVAGHIAKGPVTVRGTRNVTTSFPGFVDKMRSLGANIEEG